MSKKPFQKVLGFALNLAQVAIAVAVIVLTSWRLINVSFDVGILQGEGVDVDSACLLNGYEGTSSDTGFLSGTKFCIYAILVGVFSLVASVVFGCARNIFKCATCNACALSKVVEIVTDTAQAVWWGIAFALFVRRGQRANDLGFPRETERNAVIGLAFGGMISFVLDIGVSIWTLKSAASSS